MKKLSIAYTSSSQKNYVFSVAKVLKKLPEDVQNKIMENCFVLIFSNDYGQYRHIKYKHLIIINWSQMELDGVKWREREYVIAHEFAHFILGHSGLTKKEQKAIGVNHEKEADRLATEWGFSLSKKKKD
jgi:Zn-dependent peptidase ImmA (M78 family)